MVQLAHTLFVFLAVTGMSPRVHGNIPDVVKDALTQSLGISGARLVPLAFVNSKNCPIHHASVSQPILGSGRVPVRYSGPGCTGFAWADVQVWVDRAVTLRPIRRGQPLAGAIRHAEREVRRGQPIYIPSETAVASRDLPMGTVVTERDVAGGNGDSTGNSIKIVVKTGALAVTTQGRRISCGSGRLCAVLPSGKRVEGTLDEADQLIVELP